MTLTVMFLLGHWRAEDHFANHMTTDEVCIRVDGEKNKAEKIKMMNAACACKGESRVLKVVVPLLGLDSLRLRYLTGAPALAIKRDYIMLRPLEGVG